MNTNAFPAADKTDPIARGIARRSPIARRKPVVVIVETANRDVAFKGTFYRRTAGSVVSIFDQVLANGVQIGTITLPAPSVDRNILRWLELGYDVDHSTRLLTEPEAIVRLIEELGA